MYKDISISKNSAFTAALNHVIILYAVLRRNTRSTNIHDYPQAYTWTHIETDMHA